MCWGVGPSLAMVGVGVGATLVSRRAGHPSAVWLTLGYFTLMEVLQFASYPFVDQCGSTANRTLAQLSFAHILLQPIFVNAFAMTLIERPVPILMRRVVYGLCALSVVVMTMQVMPFELKGPCQPGDTVCGPQFCVLSGDWHIAWEFPYKLLTPTGTSWFFPDSINFRLSYGMMTYPIAFFLVPLLYGAWRFSLYCLVTGPLLARSLSDNPNEIPAIWCLFSVAIFFAAILPSLRKILNFRVPEDNERTRLL